MNSAASLQPLRVLSPPTSNPYSPSFLVPQPFLPGCHPCSATAPWLFFSIPSSLPTSSSLTLKTQLEPGHLLALLVTGQLRGPFFLQPFLLSFCVSVTFSSFSAYPTAQ